MKLINQIEIMIAIRRVTNLKVSRWELPPVSPVSSSFSVIISIFSSLVRGLAGTPLSIFFIFLHFNKEQ